VSARWSHRKGSRARPNNYIKGWFPIGTIGLVLTMISTVLTAIGLVLDILFWIGPRRHGRHCKSRHRKEKRRQ
jgi:hypothetical protein